VRVACPDLLQKSGQLGKPLPFDCSLVTPASLNAFLYEEGDYTFLDSKILLPEAVKDLSGGLLTLDSTIFSASRTGPSADIDATLCGSEGQPRHPVLVEVNGIGDPASHGHYVLITGKIDDTYAVVDPSCSSHTDLKMTAMCGTPPTPYASVNTYKPVGVV